MDYKTWSKRDGKIFLERPGKPFLAIGWVKGEDLWVSKNPDKHIFRATNSYGFNYDMIGRAKYKFLCVQLTTGKVLKTTKEFILENGSVETHNGYDTQIFLPIELFGLEQVKIWEEKKKIEKHRNRTVDDVVKEFRERLGL